LTAGWNLVGYPNDAVLAIEAALVNVWAHVQEVATYVASDGADPWKEYVVGQDPALNDLAHLIPGHAYWIKVSAACTWDVP